MEGLTFLYGICMVVDYPEHQDDRRDDRGYREERGGYREDRGGYREDRRDRGDDRRGGYERPKNPVPDQPPFKVGSCCGGLGCTEAGADAVGVHVHLGRCMWATSRSA